MNPLEQATRELLTTAENALKMLKIIGEEDTSYYAPYTITDLEQALNTFHQIQKQQSEQPAPSK